MQEFKGTQGLWERLGLSVFCNEAGKHICKIYTDKTNEIDESNAKLIAASKDLLEALQGVMKEYDDKGQLLGFDIDIARQAINKALN